MGQTMIVTVRARRAPERRPRRRNRAATVTAAMMTRHPTTHAAAQAKYPIIGPVPKLALTLLPVLWSLLSSPAPFAGFCSNPTLGAGWAVTTPGAPWFLTGPTHRVNPERRSATCGR